MYSGVHWTSLLLQGTRNTRPYITGQPVVLQLRGGRQDSVASAHLFVILNKFYIGIVFKEK